MEISYKDFRKETPLKGFFETQFSAWLCTRLSPLLAIPCIRYNIRPNTQTLAMIISGILGGVMLMLPYATCKFFAVLLYILWFTWDCSDGECARYTKTFSTYGKQMDWMAHFSCHPLFLMAVWMSFKQLGTFNMTIVSFITVMWVSVELVNRGIIALNIPTKAKTADAMIRHFGAVDFLKNIYAQFLYFPNVVIILSLLVAFSFVYHFAELLYVYAAWALFHACYVIRLYVRMVRYMYNN